MSGPTPRESKRPQHPTPQAADEGDIRRGGWILVLVGVVLLLIVVVLVVLFL